MVVEKKVQLGVYKKKVERRVTVLVSYISLPYSLKNKIENVCPHVYFFIFPFFLVNQYFRLRTRANT